ncbi:MAG: hypothetical protein OEY33_06185 [Bdellovibrionales bacterium]|nr:hypothetical protein [Bdellovibrionales bacterium]
MLENRINYQFFIIIPPGLENLAAQELKQKCPEHPFEVQKGGISVETDLLTGLGLNYILKIPNRILIRLAEFKCRDFPKLFNKLKKLEWNKFVSSKPTKIHTSSTNSRIFDSRKIEKTFFDAFNTYRKGSPQKAKFQNTEKNCEVYLRFHNDDCTVSINTSGERLHKRGYKTHISIAGMRENLASAIFYHCLKLCKKEVETIFNPMSGAGTLLIESALFFNNNINREFDFTDFPLFKDCAVQLPSENLSQYKLIGLDQSNKAAEAFKENTKNAKINAQYINGDFFSSPPEDFPQPTLTLINPPYGKRLKTEVEKVSFFNNCINAAISWGLPNLIGMVGPTEFMKRLDTPKGYMSAETLEFENGGIAVTLRVFQGL